jgi:chemotaxis protein MotB
MARKHKGGHGEGHGVDESWLLPYSDLMTLLLALFIVLFAASNIDSEKYEAIMEQFSAHFQMIGGASGPLVIGGAAGSLVIGEAAAPVIITPPGTLRKPDPRLSRLYNSINIYIGDNKIEDLLELTIEQEGVRLRLSSDAFFCIGHGRHDSQKR